MVVWLIGLSGAGKSHIGRALYARMKQDNPATVLVDGDEVRAIFRQDRDDDAYTVEGRRRNAERMRELCAWLERQDIDVVCCILSLFEESSRWNRDNYRAYFEVHVSAPMEVLRQRNPKDLYGRAARGEIGNVVGVDIPFHLPENPDLVIDNGANMVDADEAAQEILAAARRKFSA